MKAEIVSELDQNFKIIKYTFEDLEESQDLTGEFKRTYHMLVSYQVLGEKQDKACISLFEFDMDNFEINPVNFVIISQRINTTAKKGVANNYSFSSHNSANQEKVMQPEPPMRTLSVVAEDENEAGSYSFQTGNLMSNKKLNFKKQGSNKGLETSLKRAAVLSHL
jgi:hypothetical protein